MSERPAILSASEEDYVVDATSSSRVYSCDAAGQVALIDRDGWWCLPSWPGDVPEAATLLCEHTTPHGFESRQYVRIYLGQHAPDEAILVDPKQLIQRWHRHEVKIDPPTLTALHPSRIGGEESLSGIRVLPLLTATLPPATHTNCYILGKKHGLIIDPGTHLTSELERLISALDCHVGKYGALRAIVLTHHHRDHIGAVIALAKRLRLPVWAHAETAVRLRFAVHRELQEGDRLNDEWSVLHTPGHAAGHIVLIRDIDRAAIVGDMVASVGTILIDPADGHMGQYLKSLQRIKGLSPTSLHPAHGSPIWDADDRLTHYLNHRKWRESRIQNALTKEPQSLSDLTRSAYPQTPTRIMWLAERSALAHLEWLVEQEKAIQRGHGWSLM